MNEQKTIQTIRHIIFSNRLFVLQVMTLIQARESARKDDMALPMLNGMFQKCGIIGHKAVDCKINGP
jgi:hypothetical protein